jgi:hypothetical protein
MLGPPAGARKPDGADGVTVRYPLASSASADYVLWGPEALGRHENMGGENGEYRE